MGIEKLRNEDLRAREEALDTGRSFIVQAPAGSGKTELLIQRYLCLLGQVDEPEEVVAITFTRKAASEMQVRVLDALRRARAGETSDKPHEARTLAAAQAILERDAAHGWGIAASPGRLRILTFDAWCASVTRLLPVSSGMGGSVTPLESAALDTLYREAATATLDWLAGKADEREAFECVLAHLDNRVDDYVGFLAGLLARRDQWLEFVVDGGRDEAALRASLESWLAEQVGAVLRAARRRLTSLGDAQIAQLFRYAGEQLAASEGAPHPLQQVPDDGWPKATPEMAACWRAIAELLLTKGGDLRKQVDKRAGFPTGDAGEKAAMKAWLEELRDEPGLAELLETVRLVPEASYDESQWRVLRALFRVLPLAAAELWRLFAERGVTDHTQVALAAAEALGTPDAPGDLAMLLDYRIRHVLLDEMQDTSEQQYRLLETLVAGWEAGDGRTLFCVGDPMQSIYRFRQAEVGLFVHARERGIGDLRLEPLTLRQNFRSGDGLVDWFNGTFRRVFPDTSDPVRGAVHYDDAVAVPAHAGYGEVKVHPLIGATTDEEAARSAEVVETCLALKERQKVAVLVRSRTQLPTLLRELRDREVAYEAVEIDRLTDLPEIIELLALTRAVCHEGDRLAWLALLRAPWCGLRWSELHGLVRNDRKRTVRELLDDPERLDGLSGAAQKRVATLLDALDACREQAASRSLRERIETVWLSLGGAALLRDAAQLDNAMRFFDTLEGLEQAGTLPDVARLEALLDKERVSTPAADTTRVQVMTIHKAKGLQFDHVVLHALGRTTMGGNRSMLSWHNSPADDGKKNLLVSPPAPSDADSKDPLHRYIERARAEADSLEVDRLLYVGCTRAVRSLHLVGSVSANKAGTELLLPGKDTLLRRLWPVVERDFEAAFAAQPEPAGEDAADETVFAHPAARRSGETWQAPALPTLPGAARGRATTSEREVDFDWVGSSARHAGTLVHRWLERLARAGSPPETLPADFDATTSRWAQALGVQDDDLSSVLARARAAVAGTLADERGRWLLTGDGAAELRLAGLLDGDIVHISIDRVRTDGEQDWIVDYKTGSHEGGDLDRFIEQEVARYRPQLESYRRLYEAASGRPARTALYNPLLARYVEIES